MILLPLKDEPLTANNEHPLTQRVAKQRGEKKHHSVHKAKKKRASKINIHAQTAAVSIWGDTKRITRRKSEWLVETLVSCLMHFHVALYLIIDHTGAALNRVCLPDRYKQLNNSSAAVLDRMWCESGRRISCTLNQPLAVFFLQDKKGGFKKVKWEISFFFQACTRHKTDKNRLQQSATRGWQRRAIPILVLMPLQVIGEPFIGESNVTQSNGRALNHVHALKVHSLLQVDCYHVQPKPLPLPSFYPARPIYFYTLAITRNQMAVQGYKFQKRSFCGYVKGGKLMVHILSLPIIAGISGVSWMDWKVGKNELLLDILGDGMLLKITWRERPIFNTVVSGRG